MNGVAIGAGLYVVGGILTTAWIAHRGGAGRPHWTPPVKNPGVALITTIAVWPVALTLTVVAKPSLTVVDSAAA